MKENYSESHKRIVELLKSKGKTNYHGGIQLFADQYDKEWSISVNFSGTGIRIDRSEIDENELLDDELIKVYKTWTYRDK